LNGNTKKGEDNIADALSRLPELDHAVALVNLETSADQWLATLQLQVSAAALGKKRKRGSNWTHKKKKSSKSIPTPNTTSDIDVVNGTVPDSLNGTVPDTIQEQETPDIPTEKPPNTTPHKDLTAFEQQLWHHKDNEFFTHFKAKNWYQDEQDLWREKTTHRLVIPTKELRTQIMHACHDTVFSGHFGAARTLNLCERLFFWPNMKKHIQSYCSSCKVCQSIKPSNRHPVGGLQPLPVPSGKWKTVTVDMITDLPKSYCGFDSILVFVDKLTKMVHLVPTNKTMDSKEFCKLFAENVIRLHGQPDTLISDRGSTFHSKYAQVWMKTMGVYQAFSSAYHPETDGQTERANQVIENVLRSFADTKQKTWDTFLPMTEFAMNNAPNEATKQTPFMLNYGINPQHPEISKLVNSRDTITPRNKRLRELAVTSMQVTFREEADVPSASEFADQMKEAIKHVQLMLEAARHRMIQFADRTRTTHKSFEVGEYVMLNAKNLKLLTGGCNKLLPRFVGPFKIIEKINAVAFKLQLPKTMRVHNVFHSSLLKVYNRREGVHPDDDEPKALIIDDKEEYEVEVLVGKRDKTISTKKTNEGKIRKTRVEYLVQWKGYGPHHNQWIPEDELNRHCSKLVSEYNERHP